MCIPIRRWAFLWTGFSLSIPRESWYRSMPKPISLRKLHCLFRMWSDSGSMCLRMFDVSIMLKVWNHLPLSFGRLCEMVDHDFPVLDLEGEADVQCADTFEQVNYWREQIPDGTKQQEDSVTLETRWENVSLRTLSLRTRFPDSPWRRQPSFRVKLLVILKSKNLFW